MKKLSILICALDYRKELLDRLMNCLNPQLIDEVEVIVNSDNKQKTIGLKRDELLRQATGEYIAYVDDDDLVSDNYVSLILDSIRTKPDVIGMCLLMTVDKVIEEKSFHSIKYTHWWDEPDPEKPWLKRYYRNPNHLNPVKRELALIVGFDTKAHGIEDKIYSKAIQPYLKTEVYIETPIYFYESVTRRSW